MTEKRVAVARQQGSTWVVQIADLEVARAPTLLAAHELALKMVDAETAQELSFFYVLEGRLNRVRGHRR